MKTVMMTALAGLATTAAAQNNVVASDLVVSLTFDTAQVALGETATATLTASWVGSATTYLSSVNIDLIASTAGVVASDTAPVAWNLPILGYDGVGRASGGDIIGLDAAQFSLFAPPSVGNPFIITTFTVVFTDASTLIYTAQNSDLGTIAAFTISDTALPTANPAQFGVESFVSERITVPSPAGVAMLGVGGLALTRRRR